MKLSSSADVQALQRMVGEGDDAAGEADSGEQTAVIQPEGTLSGVAGVFAASVALYAYLWSTTGDL